MVFRETKEFQVENLQVLLDDVSAGQSAVGTVNGGLASSGETELSGNTLDTVSRIDVLDQSELPAGSTTLAGSDGGGSQEVLPDLQNVMLVT